MRISKRLIFASLATMLFTASAWAGGKPATVNESEDDPWIAMAVKVRPPQKHSAPMKVAIALGRVGESFLHWPRIVAETLYGDRPLVSKKGVLAARERPIEDQIYSPGE